MLKKKSFKKSFYGKVKMFQKGPFVVEFFLIVESFGYDCTHKVWPFVDLISYESIFFFFSFGK
jgi:hypothetical protein